MSCSLPFSANKTTPDWFNFANPMEVLKGYKILEYIKTLKEHKIEKTAHDLSF